MYNYSITYLADASKAVRYPSLIDYDYNTPNELFNDVITKSLTYLYPKGLNKTIDFVVLLADEESKIDSKVELAMNNKDYIITIVIHTYESMRDVMDTFAHELRHTYQNEKGYMSLMKGYALVDSFDIESNEMQQTFVDGTWKGEIIPSLAWKERPWEIDAISFAKTFLELYYPI